MTVKSARRLAAVFCVAALATTIGATAVACSPSGTPDQAAAASVPDPATSPPTTDPVPTTGSAPTTEVAPTAVATTSPPLVTTASPAVRTTRPLPRTRSVRPPPPSVPPPPAPSPRPKAVATQQRQGACDPSYPDVCLRDGIGDYDCAGGSGNGPNYVHGPLTVRAPDPFRLDSNQDGVGCEKG